MRTEDLTAADFIGKNNAGYIIVDALRASHVRWIVLAHKENGFTPWVTWEASDVSDYNFGHYFRLENEARLDFARRIYSVTQVCYGNTVAIIATSFGKRNEDRFWDVSNAEVIRIAKERYRTLKDEERAWFDEFYVCYADLDTDNNIDYRYTYTLCDVKAEFEKEKEQHHGT